MSEVDDMSRQFIEEITIDKDENMLNFIRNQRNSDWIRIGDNFLLIELTNISKYLWECK